MLNLAVGKPAPEIEGVDVDGKPLKLSDYKGKVVVLVFWGSWCGPCMAQVPHEREPRRAPQGPAVRPAGSRLRSGQGHGPRGDGAGANDLAELVRRRPGHGTDRRALPRPGLSVGYSSSMPRGSSAVGVRRS